MIAAHLNEQYVLVKAAKIADIDSNEYVYIVKWGVFDPSTSSGTTSSTTPVFFNYLSFVYFFLIIRIVISSTLSAFFRNSIIFFIRLFTCSEGVLSILFFNTLIILCFPKV